MSPEDKAFLIQCGISQQDLAVFPDLLPGGQQKLVDAAAKRVCSNADIVKFRNTRQYVKLYFVYPEPVDYPKWDNKKNPRDVVSYLTQDEKDRIVDVDGRILERKLGG